MSEFLKPRFNLEPVEQIRNHYGLDPRVYTGGKAIITQSFVEANVKVGSQWYVNAEIPIGANATTYSLFTTHPTLRTLLKDRIVSSDVGITYRVYRNATGAVHGSTDIPILNFHDDIQDMPEITHGLTLTSDPTGDFEIHGGQIDVVRFPTGQGNSIGGGLVAAQGYERVFSKNMQYLIEIENRENSAGVVLVSAGIFVGNLSTETI